MPLKTFIKDFFRLLYPKLCFCCGKHLIGQESTVCFSCHFKLPKSHFSSLTNNYVHRLFWGRIPLKQAYSWLAFNKYGKVQALFHQLKYNGQKEIGFYLGQSVGQSLLRINNFKLPDLIIPVPLHWKKERKRGYNQSVLIAEGLSKVIGIPVNKHCLQRNHNSVTQTHKKRYARWENVEAIFSIQTPLQLKGKHLLLVDDVVTTGATLESCAQKLLKIEGVSISITTAAYS